LAAKSFVKSIFDYCDGFDTFPYRGIARDDLRQGMRLIGFQRKASILIRIDESEKRVIIVGVFYGGQDYENIDPVSG